ncbi:hypothetical protein [[Phormidium ambiguum] IAM M-71]|uniref:hypothetical protein n=1 Tax=[Phormidium ambiguum] IAM M-71 TaxID=454136 RepID=UPI0015B897F5|nr:hypothetical protein [Phormidium ambiguum]
MGDKVRGIGSEFKKDIDGKIGEVTQVSGAGAIVRFEGVGNRWLANTNIEKIEETQLVS